MAGGLLRRPLVRAPSVVTVVFGGGVRRVAVGSDVRKSHCPKGSALNGLPFWRKTAVFSGCDKRLAIGSVLAHVRKSR